MRAAVFNSTKPSPPYLALTDIPSPVATPGSIVVKVLASSVLTYAEEIFNGTRTYPNLLPYVPGWGTIGVVKSAGPDVANPLLQPGSGLLVFCDCTIRARDDSYSTKLMLQGIGAQDERAQKVQSVFRNGSWAEEILVPAENVYPLPPSLVENQKLTPAKLTALTALGVAFGGLCDGDLCVGSTVVITGATGHFGSGAVAVALALGARKVIPLGRSPARLAKLGKAFNNTPRIAPVFLTGEPATDEKAIRAAAGEGFAIDVHFDILPPFASPSLILTALHTLRPGGTCILMGGVAGDVPIPYGEMIFKGITVKGVWMCERTHFPKMLGLVECGLLDLSMFDVKSFGLEEVEEAVQAAKERAGAFEHTAVVCGEL
ncbi:alcohol dehydrogenase GroES domain protein [Neolentinus lepideus HHB14362 ss-1]|uniref:Alcohol dehydrogenase GroES domain protein n=1 Tax=Neolentinus lepideus HHB14362 ss-1 TaxID=1314782 RepID=A0A165VH50_9AGAM|nr:alcohol dehydrogenase GroES domain protein [Neolentinus lepideus HHB14362 ss-1]